MLAKEIKSGSIVTYLEAPCLIEAVSVQSPSARGAATLYKFRARNLVTKQKVDITLKGTDSLPDADFEKRLVKLMYVDPTDVHLLDQTDYNEYAIPCETIADEMRFLTEDLEDVYALIYEDECVGLQLGSSGKIVAGLCRLHVKFP
ncbi:MAG TPA: translation elongation factor EF-P, partial [Pirellulaceae bacterium]|nr:translation elongation factor EF-P [Pirellulaceae bacterium]